MSEVTASAERERSSRVLQGGRVVLMSGTYRISYTFNTSLTRRKVNCKEMFDELHIRVRYSLLSRLSYSDWKNVLLAILRQ